MIDTQLPCAMFVSDFADSETLTSEILKGDIVPKCNYLEGDIKAFPWKIDTKYYQATVQLCPIKHTTLMPASVIDLMEAVVLYFDCKSVNSFDNLKRWCGHIEDDLPEILLLICDSFKDNPSDGVSRATALEWCLKNGFELIELNNSEVDESNVDYNIIPDKKGIDRIVEALHTHVWPNLDMKDDKVPASRSGNGSQSNGDLGEDTNMDSFSELFSQLRTMKESISSLPLRDRRACAEQVVSTFWNAIGGDASEIDDDQDD